MAEAYEAAAHLFKALGNSSRLHLMHLVTQQPLTVSELVAATGLSQPLVSQHLRTLREAGLVEASRKGKEVIYSSADDHITHVVNDAITHAAEGASA